MPYRLLNILAVEVPIIWGHPSVQGGWRGHCCVAVAHVVMPKVL